jgi:hypothetical protein
MADIDATTVVGKTARNERRKALATTCNALAVAVFVSALLQPLATGRVNPVAALGAVISFVALQAFLHYILQRVED